VSEAPSVRERGEEIRNGRIQGRNRASGGACGGK
jgi:hypothetical protein